MPATVGHRDQSRSSVIGLAIKTSISIGLKALRRLRTSGPRGCSNRPDCRKPVDLRRSGRQDGRVTEDLAEADARRKRSQAQAQEPLAPPGLHAAVDGPVGQRDRLLRHLGRAAARGRRLAARLHLPGRTADRRRDGLLPPGRPPRRTRRGPGRQALADDLVRSHPPGDHRVRRRGRRVRRADDGAAVRRGAAARPRDGVLRRGVPELRAGAGRPRSAARRQRQDRRQPVLRPGRRPRTRRCAVRPAEGRSDDRGRWLLRGLRPPRCSRSGPRRRSRTGLPDGRSAGDPPARSSPGCGSWPRIRYCARSPPARERRTCSAT